jgi:hypothetical protein
VNITEARWARLLSIEIICGDGSAHPLLVAAASRLILRVLVRSVTSRDQWRRAALAPRNSQELKYMSSLDEWNQSKSMGACLPVFSQHHSNRPRPTTRHDIPCVSHGIRRARPSRRLAELCSDRLADFLSGGFLGERAVPDAALHDVFQEHVRGDASGAMHGSVFCADLILLLICRGARLAPLHDVCFALAVSLRPRLLPQRRGAPRC